MRLSVLLLLGLLLGACTAPEVKPIPVVGVDEQEDDRRQLQAVSESHVARNVPEAHDFRGLLLRDLAARFHGPVDYQMLRATATQSGVAYPKYYLWVTGQAEGAARVQAVERSGFQVTHFFSKARIREHPQELDAVFPAVLVPQIRERAAN